MNTLHALFYKSDGSANQIRFVAIASEEQLSFYMNERRIGQGTFYVGTTEDTGAPIDELFWHISGLRAFAVNDPSKGWPNAVLTRA